MNSIECNRRSRVITFGTFDIFHVGHLRMLSRAAELGEFLVVGVSSDELSVAKKGRRPVYSLSERMEIISALRMVNAIFVEESLELKKSYVLENRADILVMGDDWRGKFDYLSNVGKVIYLRRTPAISTTEVIERIRD